VTRIEETQLPGVGMRHDFVTQEGERIGVITHRGGRKELLVYDHDDPDTCRTTIRLEDDDIHALAELLGGSEVTEHLTGLQQVEGVTIDWLPIADASRCARHSIGEFMKGESGVSIVAIVRSGQTIPAPPPDFELQPGDTAVAVGTPEGLKQAFARLQGD
jgi:TrkA domain protein